ncbi:MAG: 16S rRNA (cytidine(1402)-2'-O)-methyltransferase [Pseudomonadota bacterium]
MTDGQTFAISGHLLTAPPLEPGLYIVATPIGNLRDITIRALETLAACDVLACEDTRMTRRLLDRYAITARTVAYHEHNAEGSGAQLLAWLAEGKSVALVSDAGTPLISDPGYRLVRDARAANHAVYPIPGPSAVVAALSASGLPTDDFRFCGFLPTKEKARAERLDALSTFPSTLVFYEAPGRLAKTLAAIATAMGADREVVVARELTKRFETISSGGAGQMTDQFVSETVKGEIAILIAPADATLTRMDDTDIAALLKNLAADMPASKAAKAAAEQTGLPKADLYARLLAMKADG